MTPQTPIGGPDEVGSAAAEIAGAVTAVPGVAHLSGGAFGTVATYLPGHRVVGVVLTDDACEIAIVAKLHYDLPDLADQIRSAAGKFTDLPIDVTIADLELKPTADDESDRS